MTRLRHSFLLPMILALWGCETGYLWQAVRGHADLSSRARPVDEVLSDELTRDATRSLLEQADEILIYAHNELDLPDNGSYRRYADLERPVVVWNVFAAPPDSLQPRTWCFPFVGCIAYRGYFRQENAVAFSERLANDGDDTFVGGATAYSTLGRFKDPLLNTMEDLESWRLAGLLFHELAHQRLYVKDDTRFNEGFASFIEEVGLTGWLSGNDRAAEQDEWRRTVLAREELRLIIADLRTDLIRLYDRGPASDQLVDEKASLIGQARLAAENAVARRGYSVREDGWFKGEINNARLAAVATYQEYVPAFRTLFLRVDGDLQVFYQRVEALAELTYERREQEMALLLGASETATSP